MRDERADTRRPPGAGEIGLVALAFAAATLVMTWPVAIRAAAQLPAGLGDPLLNAWTLAWGANRIPHGLAGFWTPPAFYPYRGALAFSENLLGISVLVAPVQWIWGNLVLTYNVAFLLSSVVAGVGMYLLARQLTGSRAAAVVAAVFYAFCPYRAAQVTHLQVLMSGWLPVALWALHRFLATAAWPMLATFVAAFILQALSNTYSLVFSLLPFAGVMAWAAWTGVVAPGALRRLAVGVVVLGVALSPVIAAYASVWSGQVDLRDVVRYSANVSSFVQVTSEVRHARWLPGGGPEEGNFFPGFEAAALAAIGLFGAWRRRRVPSERGLCTVAGAYLGVGLLAALLCLGPEPHAWTHPLPIGGLYRMLLHVPGFAVMRVPARLATVLMLSVSVLAALGADRLLRSVRSLKGRTVGGLLLAAGVAAEGFAGPVRTSAFAMFRDKDERAVYASLRQRPSTPMLELPVGPLGDQDYSLVYQARALYHGHPVVNGVSRISTPLQQMLGRRPFSSPTTLHEGVELLRGLGVEYLVVHPGLYRDLALAEATIDSLRADADVLESWGSRGIAVFRLARWSEPPSAVGPRLPSSLVSGRASVNPGALPLALDGDLSTRWTTARPQAGDEWLELRFDRPRDIARLSLVLHGTGLVDYPSGLEVEVIRDGRQSEVVYAGAPAASMGAALMRDTGRVEIRVPVTAPAADGLRVRQVGAAAGWWWSIHELEVWQAPALPPPLP